MPLKKQNFVFISTTLLRYHIHKDFKYHCFFEFCCYTCLHKNMYTLSNIGLYFYFKKTQVITVGVVPVLAWILTETLTGSLVKKEALVKNRMKNTEDLMLSQVLTFNFIKLKDISTFPCSMTKLKKGIIVSIVLFKLKSICCILLSICAGYIFQSFVRKKCKYCILFQSFVSNKCIYFSLFLAYIIKCIYLITEPEGVVLEELTNKYKFDVFISMHSGIRQIYVPFAGIYTKFMLKVKYQYKVAF